MLRNCAVIRGVLDDTQYKYTRVAKFLLEGLISLDAGSKVGGPL